MKILPHPCATRRFGPPPDWVPEEHGECGVLEIADVVSEGRVAFMESLWRPDADELAALNSGASIVLGIQGRNHPVVYLGVTSPPAHDKPTTKADQA